MKKAENEASLGSSNLLESLRSHTYSMYFQSVCNNKLVPTNRRR